MTESARWPEVYPDITFFPAEPGVSLHVECRWECACGAKSNVRKPLSPALEDARVHDLTHRKNKKAKK